jgi:hypothetical protein
MRWLLRLFGFHILYVCDWGIYAYRYNAIDHAMCRPIHRNMSVAPPWAKMKIARGIKP